MAIFRVKQWFGLLFRIALLWLVLSAFYCSKEKQILASDLVSEEERIDGEITLTTETVLIVNNPVGSVVIAGESRTGSIGWFLFKETKAETRAKAIENLAAILFNSELKNDTIFIDISAPVNTVTETYSGLVSLRVPYEMACSIKRSSEVNVSSMDALLVVKSTSNVSISGRNGSCSVDTENGDLAIQVAIPNNGFCRATTGRGNINLEIPVITSASLTATSQNGTVSFTGLNFSDLNQQPGSLTGILGSARGEILLSTLQGDIQITGITK